MLSLVVGMTFAQRKHAAVIVVGRVLNAEDSVHIRDKFFNGLRAKVSNRISDSETYFRQVLQIDPSNHAALYELACIYHDQDDEAAAEQYAREAVTVNAYNKWYWLLLADIYKKTQNFEQLNLVFSDLINLEPDNADYYFDKANTLYFSNRIKEADALYGQIEKRFGPSDELSVGRQRLYQKEGSPGKAVSEIEKQIAVNPNDVHNYLNLANVYEKEGQSDKALEVLLKAKQINSANPYVNLNLADVYTSLGKTADANHELKAAFANPGLFVDSKVSIIVSLMQANTIVSNEQALELASILTMAHPNEAKAFAVHGDVLFQSKKFGEARTSYKKALEINDQFYALWEQLLRIDLSMQDFSAAIADGEDGLALFPNQANLYYFTALAYAQTGKPEKAVSYLRNASNLQVEDQDLLSQIYSAMGDSYHGLKRYDESDKAYEKALEINPDNTYVLNNYAYYLSLRGEQLTKAAAMSRRSNALKPDNSSFQDTYAWVLFKQGKYSEALVWIEKALINGNSGVLVEHHGDILYQLGKKELAIQKWLKAKELGVKSNLLDKKINEEKYIE